MTTSDWGILIGLILAILAPSIGGWVAVWVKLTALGSELRAYSNILERHEREHDRVLVRHEDIDKRQWATLNHMQGRLFAHDQLIASIMDKMQIPFPNTYKKKEDPSKESFNPSKRTEFGGS